MTTSFVELLADENRSTPGTVLEQHNPGMKMLLGEDPRFEWKKISNHERSGMVLTMRGNGESTLPIDDVRALLEACDQLDMKGWLHGDYSRLSSYKIYGKINPQQCAEGAIVPRDGALITPLDFKADRITTNVNVLDFSLKVSAETYRDVIEPKQKTLAIGA